MKRLILFLTLIPALLAGCGPSGAPDIPAGLAWRAQTLAVQETGELLAAWGDWASGEEDVPLLDVTAQVEDGVVTLTDHISGETYTGTLGPDQDRSRGVICALTLPDLPEGYAVYDVTEYTGGGPDATLYLVADGRTLYLTAPLPEQSK